MTSLKSVGLKSVALAVLLSAAFATQALAQAAISEPGAFAFYHPNADVLNGGRAAPPADAFAFAPERRDGLAMSARPHRAHHAPVRAH